VAFGRIVTVFLLMIRILLFCLSLATLTLTGCDNRTQEAVRWDQISKRVDADKSQPWKEAGYPWRNEHYRTGTAW
jgi:uncharacterized lipoprotein NlpE involved in copper resistance